MDGSGGVGALGVAAVIATTDDRRRRSLMARPITLHGDDARSESLLSGCIHIKTPV